MGEADSINPVAQVPSRKRPKKKKVEEEPMSREEADALLTHVQPRTSPRSTQPCGQAADRARSSASYEGTSIYGLDG